jgi:hypothetical protein
MARVYHNQPSRSAIELLRKVKDVRKSFSANEFQAFTDTWINKASDENAVPQRMEILF